MKSDKNVWKKVSELFNNTNNKNKSLAGWREIAYCSKKEKKFVPLLMQELW